jgi:hypothetical protein
LSVAIGLAAVVATGGTAGARNEKGITARGSIACDWVQGTVRFKRAFVSNGSTPGQVKIKGEVGNCRDASGENGPSPFGITGAQVHGSFTTATNRCTDLAPVTSGPGALRIRWKGSPYKLVGSVFTAAGSRYQLDADDSLWSMPADPINGSGSLTGSFSGDAAVAFGDMSTAGTTPAAMCAAKRDGGGGGYRKLPIEPGNLAILFTA